MSKKILSLVISPDVKAISVLILVCIAFFSRLFWPTTSIFATAEIGINDIWYINFPLKYFLGSELKKGQLPAWNPYRAGGYPEIAENQAGTYNLYNLVSQTLLPSITAFNLGYVLIFMTTALGMYAFTRRHKFSPFLSLYAAFLYTFSGFFVTHISHFLLIQTASFFPWLMYFTDKILKDKTSNLSCLGFALMLSQQIFSGNPQTVFISCIGVLLYTLFHLMMKQTGLKQIGLLFTSTMLGIISSAAQLLPTWELAIQSLRGQGLSPVELLFYKFPLIHLITFIFPFWFGNPQIGTYPHFKEFNGSLFWENTGYIGILPLVFSALSIFTIKNRKYRKPFLFYFLLSGASFLFMLGGDGPLYFLLLLPPFSYFRFPSRFMLLLLFGVIMLSTFGLRSAVEFVNRRFSRLSKLFGVLLIITLLHLYFFWYAYHPVITYQQVIDTPKTAQFILNESHGKIYTYTQHAREWTEFFRTGSREPERYVAYRNELSPNLNVLYGLSTVDVYSSFIPARLAYFNSPFITNYKIGSESAALDPISLHHLNLRNTTHIISPVLLTNPDLILGGEIVLQNDLGNLYVYKNLTALPKYYLSYSSRYATTLEEIMNHLHNENFKIKEEVVVEKKLSHPLGKPLTPGSIEVIEESNNALSLKAVTSEHSILVITQTYYPGWVATIDGQKTDLFPVNLVNQGIEIPSGTHTIHLAFRSAAVRNGLFLSAAGYIFLLLFAVKEIIRSKKKYESLSNKG